jgi:uncharacterized protein
MEDFIEFLRKGQFRLPVCTSCKNKMWPPSNFCSLCFSKTSLEVIDTTGTLIHLTKSYFKGTEGYYGLVEISGIRLIGSFDKPDLPEGARVKMIRCGMGQDGGPFYVFDLYKG